MADQSTPTALDEFKDNLEQLPAGTPDAETLDILAWTILGEAANQGPDGMAAIAHVIKNRAASGDYPSDLKAVALQDKQFSTWNKGQGGNDPKGTYSKTSPEFQEALRIAADVVSGRHQDNTQGATNYWSPSGMRAMGLPETPYWAASETGSAGQRVIGDHIFLAKTPAVPPTPADKPQSIRTLQAVNDVLSPRQPLPAPAPLDPNNPLGRPSELTTRIVKTAAIDPLTGMPPKGIPGVLEPGNIDLNNRPSVRLNDGSIATVRSMSFEEDGREILIPTVSPQGRILTDQQAIDRYHQTGEHLGKFASPEAATRYAEQLHQSQEKQYANAETVPTIGPEQPQRSPALASALARLGASVATKAKIDLGQPKVPTVSGGASGVAGPVGTGKQGIDLNATPGNIKTADAPYQEAIPRDVVPSSVKSGMETIAAIPKPVLARPAATGALGATREGSGALKYITKTRQVPIAANNALSAGALGASRGAALGLGAGAVSGAAAPQVKYRTETYQVPNPDYAPQGPSPEQVAASKAALAKQLADEEAARRSAAAKAANQNATAALAYSKGSSSYVNPANNAVMPTKSISGKQRNTYGD